MIDNTKMTMKWIKMLGMLGLIAACFCIVHTASLPSSQSPSSQSGLSITLSPPADPITLAAPIEIVITVKNVSDKVIGWTRSSPYGAYRAFAVLLTKDGHETETTFFHRMLRGKPRPDDPPIEPEIGRSIPSPLEPGKSFKLAIGLKRLYQITEPGEYTLEVSHYELESKTTIHSNKLTLKISGQALSSQPRLSITLSPPTDPITLAAPIEIAIKVENTSDTAIFWTSDFGAGVYGQFHFVLLTKDGYDVVRSQFHQKIRGNLPFMEPSIGSSAASLLEPGKSFTATIDLTRLYEITEPGEYTLEVSRYEQESKTTIHSNKLTLQIAQ